MGLVAPMYRYRTYVCIVGGNCHTGQVDVSSTAIPPLGGPGTVPTRTILHADLDSFFASVEQRDAPELRGVPVLVGMGVVTAASYEAKSHGIHTPMGIRAALRLCPHAIVVPPRMDAYSQASKAVFAIFRDICPEVEGLSIDEAFIDVSGLRRLSGSGREIAQVLRQRIRDEVGLAISVGVASTKFLAKVASAEAKPDGLLVVEPGDELAFLHPLAVSKLWGVGPVTTSKLAERGIYTVADVARLDPTTLESILGAGTARHLHALAHNRDLRRVEPTRRRRSVGAQRAFPRGEPNKATSEVILLEVVDRVAQRLRNGHRVARTVVLRLRFGDFTNITRSFTMPEATNSTDAFLDVGRILLDREWGEIQRRGLTKIGIAVSGLCPDDAVQLSLPEIDGAGRHDHVVDATVDSIRHRFGTRALTRASLVGPKSFEMPTLDY